MRAACDRGRNAVHAGASSENAEHGHRTALEHLLHRAMGLQNRCVGVRAGGRISVGDRNLPERLSAHHARSGIAR